MTARASRLAGAILVESDGRYFLVGNTKRPCDWAQEGFAAPAELDALRRPWIPLQPMEAAAVALAAPVLTLPLDGEAAATFLAQRFLIERNGAVSDRLWRLVLQPEGEGGPPPPALTDAGWLAALPAPLWQLIRDAVLKCT